MKILPPHSKMVSGSAPGPFISPLVLKLYSKLPLELNTVWYVFALKQTDNMSRMYSLSSYVCWDRLITQLGYKASQENE